MNRPPLSLRLVLIAWAASTTEVRAEFGLAASFLSDYVYRGISKSQGDPVAQGNLDYAHDSGWFGGLWLSQVNFGDRGSRRRARWEFYPYLGYSRALGEDWRAEAMAARYLYDGNIGGRPSDYNEYQVACHFRDLATVKLVFADDGFRRGTLWTYELTGRYPLTDTWRVSGGFGHYDAVAALGFSDLYWHLGLTWFPWRHLAFDLRYYDRHRLAHHPHADEAPGEFKYDTLENRVVLSATLGF